MVEILQWLVIVWLVVVTVIQSKRILNLLKKVAKYEESEKRLWRNFSEVARLVRESDKP